MAGTFSNRKALKLLAGSVYDKMDYIKASESLFSQETMKGAKYGKAVHGYLADPGSVYDGIVASPKQVVEVEVTGYVKRKKTLFLVWDSLLMDYNRTEWATIH